MLLNGVNYVSKSPGVTPDAAGFGADDAAWLADNGFDVVRLGTGPNSIMPTPGVVDTAYVASFAATVHMLTSHGLLRAGRPAPGRLGPDHERQRLPGLDDGHPRRHQHHDELPAVLRHEPGHPGGVPELLEQRERVRRRARCSRTPRRCGTRCPPASPATRASSATTCSTSRGRARPGTRAPPTPAAAPCRTPPSTPTASRMDTTIRANDTTHLVFPEPYVLFNFGGGADQHRPRRR